MASFSIHLAIAKRYLEENNINDVDSFIKGNIDPDLVNDKKISHYTKFTDKENLRNHLKGKVDLYKFLSENNIENDYQKGVFLHLITDYLFFNYFISKKYVNSMSHTDFSISLYYTYDKYKEYIEDEYSLKSLTILNKLNNVIINDEEKRNLDSSGEKLVLFDINKLEEFIDYVSNLNLSKYKEKIILNKKNIMP